MLTVCIDDNVSDREMNCGREKKILSKYRAICDSVTSHWNMEKNFMKETQKYLFCAYYKNFRVLLLVYHPR